MSSFPSFFQRAKDLSSEIENSTSLLNSHLNLFLPKNLRFKHFIQMTINKEINQRRIFQIQTRKLASLKPNHQIIKFGVIINTIRISRSRIHRTNLLSHQLVQIHIFYNFLSLQIRTYQLRIKTSRKAYNLSSLILNDF